MKFADSHEWIRYEEGKGTVGISSFAKNELGTIVYVELPKVGQSVKAGEEIAILESTKAAADIYSPVSGVIVAINLNLKANANLINQDPEGQGWLFEIALSDHAELDQLMDQHSYLQHVVCTD